VRRRLHRDRRLERIADGRLADIIDEAVLISAITCERAGADPPRLDEVLDRLRPGHGPQGLAGSDDRTVL
jgi:hypothetical protein